MRYFTDSSAVLGMLGKDSASFLEFVGTRVSEIRIKSDPEKQWFWIPGDLNLADQGTRPTVLPKDMGPGTPYQVGLPWMRDPEEAWPVKRKFLISAGRGMQERRAESSRRGEDNFWARVSSARYHEGQAGAHLCVRVHGSGALQEAASIQPSGGSGEGSHEEGALGGIRAAG